MAILLGAQAVSAATPGLETPSVRELLTAPAPARTHRIKDARALEQVRSRVWSEWATALTGSMDSLAVPCGVRPLNADTAAIWTIPETLEPSARMAVRYGIKGDAGSLEGLPLFIYLHGSGPRDIEWNNGLSLCSRFDDAPSAYIIPRIPNEGEWYRWYHRGKQQAYEAWLRAMLAQGVDPARIYMFGISEGGYGSQRLASFYADYLAGAGPMAGGEPLRNAPPENLRNTAFSLLTGSEDRGFYRNQLTGVTAAALDSLSAIDSTAYVHRVELLPGYGHGIDYSLTTPWLAKHSRPYMPRRVSWENFEMDGRKRDAFYNLAVVEPEGRDADGSPLRTRYELSVDSASNTVDLAVYRVHYTVTLTDPHWGIQLLFSRSYEPADEGLVRVYLAPEMLDLSKPVRLRVNGRDMGRRKLTMTEETVAESCRLFGDPMRLYPAKLDVVLGK